MGVQTNKRPRPPTGRPIFAVDLPDLNSESAISHARPGGTGPLPMIDSRVVRDFVPRRNFLQLGT